MELCDQIIHVSQVRLGFPRAFLLWVVFPVHEVLQLPTVQFRVEDLFDFEFLGVIDEDWGRRDWGTLGLVVGIFERREKDFVEDRVYSFPPSRQLQPVTRGANLFDDWEGTVTPVA